MALTTKVESSQVRIHKVSKKNQKYKNQID